MRNTHTPQTKSVARPRTKGLPTLRYGFASPLSLRKGLHGAFLDVEMGKVFLSFFYKQKALNAALWAVSQNR